MDAKFWLEKWEKNEIAFHGSEANPLLVKYFKELSLAAGSRVFVPLCGKSLDMVWLLSQGYRVAGAELAEAAVQQFFSELGVEAQVSVEGKIKRYHAESVDIFVGDIFELTKTMLEPVDAVYDRAALVALPEVTRSRYVDHVRSITGQAPQLVICYEYDQSLAEGPPFSINSEEIRRYYGASYRLASLECAEVPGGLKGKCPARENVWLLSRSEKHSASKDPLHGVTLKAMLEQLVAHYGWARMAENVDINCFIYEPSITSSLRFLRRTPWARTEVEQLYLQMLSAQYQAARLASSQKAAPDVRVKD